MEKNDSVASADEGERARISAEERDEKIAKLKLRPSKLSDEEVALLNEVFPKIVADHNDQVMEYLRRKRVEGQDAADIRQQVFLAFYKYIVNKGFPDDIPRVLQSFARGRRMNYVRAKERSRCSGDVPSSKPKSGDLELALHNRKLARFLFSKLSLEHQAVINKVIREGLTHTEAAEVLGIPEGTLKSRVLAARRALSALAEEFVSASQRAPL